MAGWLEQGAGVMHEGWQVFLSSWPLASHLGRRPVDPAEWGSASVFCPQVVWVIVGPGLISSVEGQARGNGPG